MHLCAHAMSQTCLARASLALPPSPHGEEFHQCKELATMAGTGPEYSYPVTGKDEPIPVVDNEDPVVEAGGAGAEPVVGEDAPELNDKDIADEERLETREAGEWTEDMASNEPLEGEEVDPDLAERLPSDRG
ncbi:hypothetical protein KC19_4G062900 [Ceratodon purpureus]|uniref:Uncharacterized protein n=1 Tax=Ceratodon purpureus TaxID=3225 RepID=A0A8T0I8C7_CERPU|nr:hypothetical protein KC19_4G062900 [Ceratodon purpureus]